MLRKIERTPWYAKEWMAHKDLKGAHIVSRTGYTKSMVSEYLSGTRRWNADVLAAFAYAIGVDEPADLLRPPWAVHNDLARYLMKMDEKRRAQALRVIKAMAEEAA